MFTIIYEKSNGKVLNITSESNAEDLRLSIPETSDFIFVESLPARDFYRQGLIVENGALVVKNLVLTKEQEERIVYIETLNEINDLKQKLLDTDYQAIKYAEGVLSESEYSEMKAQRQLWRTTINELESKIESKIFLI